MTHWKLHSCKRMNSIDWYLAAPMVGHTRAVIEDHHGALGDTYVDLVLHQLIRHRVVAAFGLDSVADADACVLHPTAVNDSPRDALLAGVLGL